MSDTSINPVIAAFGTRHPMVICNGCGIGNQNSDDCMVHGPVFQPPTIFKGVEQYNSENVSNPKIPPTYWSLKPPLTQNLQQCTPPLVQPYIKCTDSDTIDTTFQSDSFSPQINIFSVGDNNQVPV